MQERVLPFDLRMMSVSKSNSCSMHDTEQMMQPRWVVAREIVNWCSGHLSTLSEVMQSTEV